MANVTTIISDFRFDANADTNQITDNQALSLLNRVYRDYINEIRQINEDYFYDYWKTDTVAGQEEYSLQKRTTSLAGIIWVKSVWVKYNANYTDYVRLRYESMNTLERDLFWYKDNQSNQDPFYTISDNSIFIFPAPEEAVTEWYIIYGIWDPIDLTLASVEADIKLPLQYHHLLNMWMKKYYFASIWRINEKNDVLAELNNEKQKMLKQLSLRNVAPVQVTEPILTNLY